MSFGGAVSAMITTLKNNKLPQRDQKLGHLEYNKGVPLGKPLQFQNNFTLEELVEFSVQFRKLQKKKRRREIVVISVISALIMGVILFFLS